MKIAIIGFYGFYGSMAEWVANAFEKNENKVLRIDRKNIYIPKEYKIALFVDCSEDYSEGISIQDNVYKVFWSMDAQMPGGIERSVNIGRKCNLVFSSNNEHGVLLLRKFGVDSILLPVTYSDSLLMLNYIPKKHKDVVMIGNPNSPERVELWKELDVRYDSFTGRCEDVQRYVTMTEDAKIIVNQPTEPFDNILNNRFFEGMAVGALILQKRLRTTLIEDLGFIEDVDFVYWQTFDELFKLTDYYLAHELKRYEIAFNGYTKVQKYKMSHQCKLMQSIINERTK